MPQVWEGRFDTEEQAKVELESLQIQRQKLMGAVGVSLDAVRQKLQRSGKEDRWVDISLADYLFLTSNKPNKVAFAYRSALAGAPDFYFDSASAQIGLFQHLGVLTENTKAIEVIKHTAAPAKVEPGHVVLFTGHMIDTMDTNPPRFPQCVTDQARDAIRSKLKQEIDRTAGPVIGIGSCANGGDLLFHEVCEELKIEHRLYLPLPPDRFRNESVSPGGRYWEDRFDNMLTLCSKFSCLTDRSELPLWLSVKAGYTTWQRANLWLIQEALAVGAKNVTLLALWDGNKTDGLGGTYHMRSVAEKYGAALLTIYTADLVKSDGTSAVV